jgi:hypothetical protein
MREPLYAIKTRSVSMEPTINLHDANGGYKLCFVRAPWAYFTRLPLDQQWGDGWERAPYNKEAGAPYDEVPGQILTVAFEGPLDTPDVEGNGNIPSVIAINHGETPWLYTDAFVSKIPIRIMGGDSLQSFVEQVERAGGRVFAPSSWGALRLEPVGDRLPAV